MASPSVFRLLAHELRSPASVISGYARMLREGRLDEPGRAQALAQIERAGNRIAVISRQASDLGRWLGRDHDGTTTRVALHDVLARSVALSSVPDLRIDAGPGTEALTIVALDHESLAASMASLIDAVRREVVDDTLRVVTRATGDGESCDVLIGAASRLKEPDTVAGPDTGEPFALDRGGQGLALLVASSVLSAHQSQLWSIGGRSGIVGIRLLPSTEQDRK